MLKYETEYTSAVTRLVSGKKQPDTLEKGRGITWRRGLKVGCSRNQSDHSRKKPDSRSLQKHSNLADMKDNLSGYKANRKPVVQSRYLRVSNNSKKLRYHVSDHRVDQSCDLLPVSQVLENLRSMADIHRSGG